MSTRITDLPQAETLNGSEIMPLVQNGVTKKATLDFINLASPAGLILQQTQQVYQDTLGVKSDTEGVLVETQSVLGDTQVVLGQTIGVRNETQTLKLDFETQYLGSHASPPTLDNEGNPLQNGALYWDTTLMAMFVWSGVSWTAFSSAVASVNGFIGEVILNFRDVGAAGPGANTNITSLGGLTGDVATATGLQFDTAAPSAGAVGKLTWNTTDQTLDLGVSAGGAVLRVGQEVYYRVKNGTAGVIPNGSMVRYTGTEGLTGNILVAPALADGTYASQTFLGLTTEVLNPGDSGFATHFGRVRGIDTTGNPYGEVWADGDVIFASALVAGWLTKVLPAAPNNRVRVGIVVHAHPNGVLFVNPAYGGKLSENEQVQLTSLADGDVLKYVAANSRFENMSFAAAGVEPLGAAAASMSAHLAEIDPHPQYTTAAEASAAAPVQSVVGKTGAVTLVKADVGLGNVANVLQAAAARVLTAGNGLTGGGDLSADRTLTLGTPSTLTTGTANAVTATSHTHAVTFPVTSVAGKTGAVALVKADVGLDQVDNTSDADKPVSTATATALNLKFDKAGGSITGNTNIAVNSASEALRITQTGTGLALRVEDSANPDSTPFAVDANGNVGVKTAAPAVSFAVNASDAILVPIGSTANRPTGATGYFRFNTELAKFEGYDGTAWGAISKPDASLVGFQQAGTGAIVRTAQDKLREVVSIKDFGARSITETGYETFDSTAAIQAALNYVHSIGGGVVYIPPGRYRKADTSPTLVMYSNTTIRGEGDCSVIFHDDQPANPRRDLLSANNTSSIAFENFKIEGTLQSHTVETNQSQALTGIGINGFRMSGVTIQSVRYMATAFVYVRGGVVRDCRFIDVLRDGVRFTHSQDISIIGNVFKRVADDAVALHSLDTDSAIPPPAGVSNWGAVPTQSGLIVSGNTFEACQGIKILGAKVATVSGNTMRRMLRLPITVDSTINLPEGNTPVFCVSIVDNIITDTLLNFNTPDGGYAVRVKVRNRSKGALASQPGYVSDVSLFNWDNNIDAPGAVSVGAWGITIARNTIATTLPVSGVAKYSDYGYGNLLDRQGGSFGPGFYDPTITSNFFSVFGIRVEGPVRGLLVESNTLSGGGVGVNAIDLTGYSASNGIDREAAIIRNNTITDWPGTGIAIGSDGNSSSVIVTGNWLDLDPLFRHPAHSATENTWTSGDALVGLATAAGSYGVAERNTFLHMSRVTGNIEGFSWGTNYVIYDPNGTIGLDGPANCRGVRAVPSSIKFVHLIYDGNPASATFKRIITTPKLSASAMPSSGTYVYGHVVQASVPATLSPGAGQEYSIVGWQRITTGSGHTLNVDWKELRCLTGQ